MGVLIKLMKNCDANYQISNLNPTAFLEGRHCQGNSRVKVSPGGPAGPQDPDHKGKSPSETNGLKVKKQFWLSG
jgi:hypothetical protein